MPEGRDLALGGAERIRTRPLPFSGRWIGELLLAKYVDHGAEEAMKAAMVRMGRSISAAGPCWTGEVRSTTWWQRLRSSRATFSHSRERVGRGSEISLAAWPRERSEWPAPPRQPVAYRESLTGSTGAERWSRVDRAFCSYVGSGDRQRRLPFTSG